MPARIGDVEKTHTGFIKDFAEIMVSIGEDEEEEDREEAMARLVFGLSLALLLLFFSCSPLAFASPKKPVSVARREDIPFIKCQVCEKIAREIHNLVQKKEALVSPKKV